MYVGEMKERLILYTRMNLRGLINKKKKHEFYGEKKKH